MQTNLGRAITEIQRDAAGTSTPDLRSDIEVGLEVLNAVNRPSCMRCVPERT